MKHEKIVLVVLGYVIGFTTAFIGYAFGDQKQVPKEGSVHREYPHGFVQDITSVSHAEAEPKIVSFEEAEDGLFAVLSSGDKRAVSAQKESAEMLGHHAAIYEVRVSPEGVYLYFCAQLQENDATCTPAIYQVAEHSLHPVIRAGEPVLPKLNHSSSWSSAGVLSVAGMSSIDSHTPWMVQ